MKKRFLFISCEEAKHICDKSQYGESTFWERFKLSIRLSWCHVTKSYSSKNNKLTHSIKQAEVDCLKNDERNKLKQQFEKELAKHQ
ncbi:hypothetical protein [Winogradskyella aquimaris]|uniref:Glycine dehydrogenase n=1 Tax=Winogradskyella aquimaris TaxID=864074 RepID=A0ABU5ELZ2_9FLAO|nr:hypothetical protein [Winogradskyella aquimaris]MDY2587440.1 hypothetical protein [Winogradskyella aquimaris]